MVLGIGIDVLSLRKFARVLDKHGDRFIELCYQKSEQQLIASQKNRILFYARHFVAKEAVSKALGTGFRPGIHAVHTEVCYNDLGLPKVILHGKARGHLESMIRVFDDKRTVTDNSVLLTISDDADLLTAVAIVQSD